VTAHRVAGVLEVVLDLLPDLRRAEARFTHGAWRRLIGARAT